MYVYYVVVVVVVIVADYGWLVGCSAGQTTSQKHCMLFFNLFIFLPKINNRNDKFKNRFSIFLF